MSFLAQQEYYKIDLIDILLTVLYFPVLFTTVQIALGLQAQYFKYLYALHLILVE